MSSNTTSLSSTKSFTSSSLVIDPVISEIATRINNGVNPLLFFKRFLDDIFLVYTGCLKNLHLFLSELNNIHPTIKFTMNHTTPSGISNPDCGCETSKSLAFLDTSCAIENGKIVTDLYRKKTDRNQYLLTSSCHPAHTTKNIPFSLALRIVRICSKPEDRDTRFKELKELLLSREYKPGLIDSAINKAKQIPRTEALKKVERATSSKRPVFVVSYDPRLPSITKIVTRHWRTMHQDPYLAYVFPLPPIVAHCQNPTQLNSTQHNSKASSVGVRHSSHVFHPTPPHHPTHPLPQTLLLL